VSWRFSTECGGGVGFSTTQWSFLIVSVPETTIEGMETADVTAQKVLELATTLAALPPAASEAANIDRIQQLEQAKRVLAAAQATATNAFVDQRQARETAARITSSEQLKGIEAEVGLARGESAFVGAAFTHTATALCTVLPNTMAALAAGRLSEYHARIVAEQTNHLGEDDRRAIDAAIAHRLGKASSSQLRKLVQGHAYRLDREAAERRAADNARRRRRVCLEPAGDGMVRVAAELPTHQGLAVMAALNKRTNQRIANAVKADFAGTTDVSEAAAGSHLDAAHDPHGTAGARVARDQVMADIFVETLTGQTTADGVAAEVVVIMDETTVFANGDLPAWVPGHGPLPVGMVKQWLADPAAAKFFRRMYTRPSDGQLVALESARRRFPDGLAKMLALRDDTCATPGCNSAIQDSDHRRPWAQGGPTSWANGTGLCKRCNQRKENRGWSYDGTPDQLVVTTPTGHTYSVGTLPPISHIRRSSDPPTIIVDIVTRPAA